MGAPRKYDPEKCAKIILKYAENEDVPIFKEVCYLNNWNWKYMYELADKHEILSDSIKMLIQKKEVQLEKKSLFNEINHTQAIFSLKQLGWKDKKDMAISVDESAYDELKKIYEKGE